MRPDTQALPVTALTADERHAEARGLLDYMAELTGGALTVRVEGVSADDLLELRNACARLEERAA